MYKILCWAVISSTALYSAPIFQDNYLSLVIVEAEIQKIESECPANMVHVHGNMLAGDSEYIEALQNNTCTKWINKTFPTRCESFNRNKWLAIAAKLPRKFVNFCMDKFEYPNQIGSMPQVYMNWEEARQICQEQDKDLCNEEEWSFACEGEEGTPYPYGYNRNADVCGIDKDWIEPNYNKLFGLEFNSEIKRLWQGYKSGKHTDCKSIFGIYDLTGNVDEFTTSVRATGYPSILKGGYWAKVRARCRPSTRIHNQWHKNYQLGFRCCKKI